jgi:hypothetical protein
MNAVTPSAQAATVPITRGRRELADFFMGVSSGSVPTGPTAVDFRANVPVGRRSRNPTRTAKMEIRCCHA